MTSRMNKTINKIYNDLEKHYDPFDDQHDIMFASIVLRNLPRSINFFPPDDIQKFKTAYLIGDFHSIDLSKYIEEKRTPEEANNRRKSKKNEWLKKWSKDKKYHCDLCDVTISYMSKSDHSRSKKHLKKLEQPIEIESNST